jgi:hypothetical protein
VLLGTIRVGQAARGSFDTITKYLRRGKCADEINKRHKRLFLNETALVIPPPPPKFASNTSYIYIHDGSIQYM